MPVAEYHLGDISCASCQWENVKREREIHVDVMTRRTSLFAIQQCRRRDRKVRPSRGNVGDIHIFTQTHVPILICPGPPVANSRPFAHRAAFMNPTQLYADERKRTLRNSIFPILISRRWYEGCIGVHGGGCKSRAYSPQTLPRHYYIIDRIRSE